MATVLQDLEGTLNLMGDICVYGSSMDEHNKRLHKVLQRLVKAGVTLNSEKCVFGVKSMTYLGYVVDKNGVHPDPNKLEAISKYPTPSSVSDVRRFLGMVNQLAKFVPNITEMSEPLRMLLQKSTASHWDASQEESFAKLKKTLLSADVLINYKCDAPTRLAADASSSGLGSVLLQ